MKKKVTFIEENSLAWQCFEQIKTEIIDGVLIPGEKLRMLDLKERFSVGHSPIREALSQLVALGLVTSQENKGFRVATVSESNIRDIYATFTLIETTALKWSFQRGDIDWETRVISEYHKLSQIENKKETVPYNVWSNQNYKFHLALISGCDSPVILDIQKTLYLKFDRYVRMAYNMATHHASVNHDKEKTEAHKKLLEYALSRNIDKAIELMNYHINGPLEDIIKILKKKKLI